MKPSLIFAAVCAFTVAVSQSGRADVSVNFFYDNLNGGNWYEVADYGYVWQPDAATNPDWRPYTDGYWAYTDVGWTWVSYEDFGWATYHYGRWIRLEDYGWCWVPGYEWGPAWVSWRTGGDYIGWAPLPPAGPHGEIVYESRPIGGHVDVDFGIGPAYYNFIDIRYIGEPVLIGHYHPYAQNVVYINNTVNVTNITYNNSIVYNYGPDYAVLSRYSTRPIQRLKLERTNIDPLQAVKGGNVTKVQGDKLVLAAPLKVQKPASPVAPKAVKAKIAQPKIEKGWANIADPRTRAKLEQKLKTENPKNVPPPTSQPKAATANVSPLSSPGSSPFEKGKGKRTGETLQNQAGAAVDPGTSPGSLEQERDKRGKQRFQNEASASAAAGSSPVTKAYQQGKGKPKGQRFENGSAVSDEPTKSSPAEYPEQGKAKKKEGRGEYGEQNAGYGMKPQSSNRNPQNENNPDYREHKGNRQGENAQPESGSSGGGNKYREQSQSQVQPQRGQYGQPQAGQGQPRAGQHGQQQGEQQQGGEGKGKGKKGSPTPPPQ